MSGQNIYQMSPLIGQQPGVQINPAVDRTDRLLQESGDQTFAIVAKLSRGRIDTPMRVSADRLIRYCGRAGSLRVSELNSSYIQIVEAITTGAAAVVVSRLVSDEALNQFMVINHGTIDTNTPTSIDAIFTLSEEAPTGADWFAQIKVADCINEGVMVELSKGKSADQLTVKIRERKFNRAGKDIATGEVLYEVTGSTNVDAVDDSNQSTYIGDVAEKYYGDWLQIEINQQSHLILASDTLDGQTISKEMLPFSDTGNLTDANFVASADAIRKTGLQYRYIICDSANTALLNALYLAAVANNRKMIADVPGNLKPGAAIIWKNQFNFDAQDAMYTDWIWTPVKRQDPTQKNGIVLLSSVGQKVGYSCERNGRTNGFGLPPLHQPIAGSDFRLTGTNFTQIYEPDNVELADLAEARINPCIYQEYHNGSGWVWSDSLSGTEKTGISKLSSATEIVIWLMHYFGRYSKSHLQKPMTERIKKQKEEMEKILTWAEASGWLVPSVSLGGVAFTYEVARNIRYPDDRMDWTMNVSIEGVVRQVVGSTNMYSVD
ncbi:hypothetical protein LVJ82_17275 [Vitreoscilla massiliensis]|uniref:Tail sheath protein n=1 Tax=Vitreoscilla massiliensis TaxID=1689272 RepID=A0ABY4E727_9NEIS|nr:hypothetical protein [Vitreoscilla massiliensis]UOO89172.1 hypothetical protein LVJ82_17275 [Vitreoscilla massiliensis]